MVARAATVAGVHGVAPPTIGSVTLKPYGLVLPSYRASNNGLIRPVAKIQKSCDLDKLGSHDRII